MKRFLTIIFLAGSILFTALNGHPKDCEIPGKTIQWIADYCMHEVGSDDLLDEKVQSCLEKNRAYTLEDTCENKITYKMTICGIIAARGEYKGKAELCFNDVEFIPATVKNNITDKTANKEAGKEKERFGYLSQHYYLPVFFVLFWCAVCLLISSVGGWRKLGDSYRANFAFEGKKLRMKSVSMRWGVNYSGCLTIGVNKEGLFLALIPIFRLGHPPLYVPWHDISTEETKRLVIFRVVKCVFSKCPDVPMMFSKKLAEKIFSIRDERPSEDYQTGTPATRR